MEGRRPVGLAPHRSDDHIGATNGINAMGTLDRDDPPAETEAKRSRSEKKIPRARPIEGEVDHATLTRWIIARFPKILAALAK